MNDLVELNVGGTLFATTRSTLTKHPDSMLARMFSPDNGLEAARTDKTGAYFIDRNPKAFELILEYLRTGLYSDHLNIDPRMVQVEADYFGLQGLANEATSRLDAKDQVFYLNVKGTMLTVLRDTLLAAGPDSVLAAILNDGETATMPRDGKGFMFVNCKPEDFKIILNLLETKQFPFDLGPGVVEGLARRFNIGWMVTMAREFGPKRVVYRYRDADVQAGILQYPEKRLLFGEALKNGVTQSYAEMEDKGVYRILNNGRVYASKLATATLPQFQSDSSFWTNDERFQWKRMKRRQYDLKAVKRRHGYARNKSILMHVLDDAETDDE